MPALLGESMTIELKDIQKKFGKKQVLSGVNMSAQSGECIGILGANGSGKSTLLSLLAGVLKADKGEFILDGTDLFKSPKVRSRAVGFVPQGTPLIEELTAYDNLFLWYDRATLKTELESGMLYMLGINDFLKLRVSKMSGGMKKRLSIGCAIAKHPPVFLLDEPMSALDIACKQKIKDYLESYKNAGGIVILVTHDILELNLADRCYILKDGKLTDYEFSGDTEELVKSIL